MGRDFTTNFFWGGPAEYTLFAYAFKCHVVCLRQLNSQVDVFCTREFHRKISNDIDRKRFTQMAEMLRSPSDVIFIWHHKMTKPRHKLGNEEIGYGNHYSFLEYDEKKKKKLFYDTFKFQHTPSCGGIVNLSLPEQEDRTEPAKNSTERKEISKSIKGNQESKDSSTIIPNTTTNRNKNTETTPNTTPKISKKSSPHLRKPKQKKSPVSTVASRLEERRNKKKA
jgi:hypothetical protein